MLSNSSLNSELLIKRNILFLYGINWTDFFERTLVYTIIIVSIKEHVFWFYQVRIEDDVVITSDGCELMTDVPRTVEEIEAHMATGRGTNEKVLIW